MNQEQIKGIIEAITPLVVTYALRIVGVLILLWIAFRIARWAGDKVTESLESKEFDVGLARFFGSLARWGIIAASVLGCLGMFGVETTSFAAVIGAAGLAVGLAFQGTLSNFASGVMIMLYRPFEIGDAVSTAGVVGKVDGMTLVSTTVKTFDNQTIIVPNSMIWGDVITNITANTTRRVDMTFGIGYQDDIDKAKAVLHEIVESHPKVLKDPEPVIQMHELADSSVNFIVRPWARTEDYWDVYWAVTRQVKERFDAEGISIPYPQRDVHVYQETQQVSPAGSAT